MDTENILDACEMQEHKKVETFNHQSSSVAAKWHERSYSIGKLFMFSLITVLVLIFLALFILLGLTINCSNNTHQVCENSQPSTGALSGGTANSVIDANCNCSNTTDSTWSSSPAVIAQQIGQLLNTTKDTSSKMDSIMNYTSMDHLTSKNTSKLLSEFVELFDEKIGQVLTMTQDTATKIDAIGSSSNQQPLSIENITDTLLQVWQTTGDSAQKLMNIINTLSALEDTSASTAGVVDDIFFVVDQLLELQNQSSLFSSIETVSCKDIKTLRPSSLSGYYRVNAAPYKIFCNMGEMCGSGGGWTRLAYLNMADATQNCPSGFRLRESGGVRACGRQYRGCVSVQFPSNGISYSQVCGRVVGYQYGTTDAVDGQRFDWHNDLNSGYVDGVSITRGSPRQHVWTLICGYSDSQERDVDNCPCSNGSAQQVQSFVGSHYFCESGNPTSNTRSNTLHTSDPLWDGKGCGSNEQVCCSAPGLPWFHRDYGNTTTTDFLELRVCADETVYNEDVPVGFYEIFVK